MPLKPKLEVISADDFEEIHRATIKLLEETGIVFYHEAVLSKFKDHGGNYLLHDATLKRCRDRWRASHSYCGSYNDWQKEGARDIVQRANKTCKEILAAAPASLIDPSVEEELCAYIDTELKQF